MTTKKTENKPHRYDGAIGEVAEFTKSKQEHRDALAELLEKIESIDLEIQKAAEAEKRLPVEIDSLLHSGKMDEATVEQLARKRAHLDLIPGRLQCLRDQLQELKTSKDVGRTLREVNEAIHHAGLLFEKKQIDAALPDYMALGVDEEIAKEQIALRPDIYTNALDYTNYTSYMVKSWSVQIRMNLAAFDCLAAGFFPISPAAEKIAKKWNVQLLT
jgi:hypothetical protein